MNSFLFVGIRGTVLTEDDKETLLNPSVAGVILFTRNYSDKAQLKAICKSIISLKTPRLLISVDHEGGLVQRFINDFTQIPSPSSFLETKPGLKEAIREVSKYAKLSARELSKVGVDINFSPCLDLDWGRSQIMASRCYSADPTEVSSLGSAFIHHHYQLGVITVAKHFPGHGFATADSHLEKSTDDRNFEEISVDLSAFQMTLPVAHAVMSAHVKYSQVDPTIASMSQYWIKEVLRKQLKFKGVLFSDDIEMKGCDHIGTPYEKIKKTLMAGTDYVIWGNDFDAVSELLGEFKSNTFTPYFSNSRAEHITKFLKKIELIKQ